MPNEHVLSRLNGIQTMLRGVHQSNASMSSATKGTERQAFIDDFVSRVLPAPFRFGTGDATDHTGKRSGQLDVVVEYPFIPSLPIVGAGATRLYLAESIAAVIEVKSDLSAQWNEVVETATQLEPLRREFGATMTIGAGPLDRIPIFVAGYQGWKNVDTVKRRLADGPIDGALVIDPGVFVSTEHFKGMTATGPWALWALICCLHQATSTLRVVSVNPLRYALD